jgi:hypothetical protein
MLGCGAASEGLFLLEEKRTADNVVVVLLEAVA